ncbi:MAG TPA: ABC transporter permease, partial [Blastocatellia bacterium]|nr:ABC transporter permease [Blastocatellia bacterium]
NRLRNALVVSQVAVSLVVLICAGLFIQSSRNAEKMDLGFRTENLFMMSVDVELQGYDQARGKQFYKQALDRARTLPGVLSAAISRNTPLGYNNTSEDIILEGRLPSAEEDRLNIFFNVVSTDYFQTLGIPILQGRDFTERDDESAPKVAIVNETMARRLWPGQDPLGKRFRFGREGALVEVVGVARDGKYVFLGEVPRPFFYVPLAQNYRSDVTLFLHTAGDPAGLTAGARQVVRELDKDMPVYDVKTMTSHLRDGLALLFVRLGAALASAFGLLGLTLAVVGIYGVISYTVSQRTHEIGLRMALGAQSGDVLRMVIGRGIVLTLIGVGIGLAAALALTRVMTSLLYGVSATDPATFIGIPLLFAAVALAASFIPARRAMKVDPMVALRHE